MKEKRTVIIAILIAIIVVNGKVIKLNLDPYRLNYSLPLLQNVDLFVANISLGSTAQNFTVAISATSSDFWLPDMSCDTQCTSHKFFPSLSKTFKKMDECVEISLDMLLNYGLSLSGPLGEDVLTIGNATVNNSVVLVDEIADGSNLNTAPFQGTLGLAAKNYTSLGKPSILKNLLEAGKISESIVSYSLAEEKPPSIILGGSDSSLYSGSFSYVNITNAETLTASFDSLRISGDKNLTICADIKCEAIFDPLSPFIIIPPKFYEYIGQALNLQISREGVVDCSKRSSLPNIELKFGNANLVLKPTDFIRQVNSSMCVTTAISSSLDSRTWTFGSPLFKNYYIEFDYGKSRIGFARNNGNYVYGSISIFTIMTVFIFLNHM